MKNPTVLGSPCRPRRTSFTVEYDLSHVVDLTDPYVLAKLKIEPADLLSNWKLDVLGGRVLLTHEIGSAAHLAGIEALRVPSARHDAATNVVVISRPTGIRRRHGH